MSDNLTVNIPSKITNAEAPSTPETEQATSLIPAEQANELPDPEQASPEQAAEVLSSKGLDVTAFENEYAQNGSLSSESYQKLADAGLNKDMVDRYIQASSIIAGNFVTEMKGLAGGTQAMKPCLHGHATVWTARRSKASIRSRPPVIWK